MSDEDMDTIISSIIKDGVLSDSARELLKGLTAREAKVLRSRFGIDVENMNNIEAVGKQFNITRQRIKEIEEKALRRLRERGPGGDGPSSA